MDKLQSLFPSDKLSDLRRLIEAFPALRPILKELIQIWFVVDASIIQGELRWRLGSRINEKARSSFHECIESGLFVAVAPIHLKAEIQEHLAEIACDENLPLAKAEAEWATVQEHLHFYQPKSSSVKDIPIVDPDDLPYKLASDELGFPIYSPDRHFQKMDVPLIAVCLDLTARKYARAASIRVGIAVHSTITVMFAVEAVAAFCRMIKGIVSIFARLPKWVQFSVVGLLAGLIIHPKSRAKLISWIQRLCEGAKEIKPELLSSIAQLMSVFAQASSVEQQTGEEIRSVLPPIKKRSALMHVRAAFITTDGPLSIVELEKCIRKQGYLSRARNLKGYLRRVLIKSGQFFEVSPGLWSLKMS